MANSILDGNVDYWSISRKIKELYMSNGSVNVLLDFERVLDEVDIYAFKNWDIGELVEGPVINRYLVKCTFMWLHDNMPDPRGAKRLIPFDCTVKYKKSTLEIAKKVESYDDFIPGTKKPKLIKKPIWLVEITMPKDLLNDIQQASGELENQDVDLDELNLAYEEDLDTEETKQEA